MPSKTTFKQQQALYALRQIHFDMETTGGDLEILLNQIVVQIDTITNPDENTRRAIATINCFASCALAQSQKIKLQIENAQMVMSDANLGDDHA
ncbi:MAG: hypothetical protein NVS3B3_10380 [Aquirhabdus sp.]